MKKSDFRSGMYVTHKNLGKVFVDESCIALNHLESDTTSCFVVHDGDIKEVTLSLVKETNDNN